MSLIDSVCAVYNLSFATLICKLKTIAMRKIVKVILTAAATVLVAGYLIPERKAMPCCTPAYYNHSTFWYWPWTRGVNGHPHTGVDIFGGFYCV